MRNMNLGNISYKPSCVNCVHMFRVGGGNFKCCEPTINPKGNLMSIQLAFNNTCKKYEYDEEPVKSSAKIVTYSQKEGENCDRDD